MSEDTTDALQRQLDRLRQGDRDILGPLIERAARRLERLAHRIFKNGPRRFADTDDLLQDGLMRLTHTLGQRPPNSVEHFFSLAALEMRHALIDLIRRHYGPHGDGRNQLPASIKRTTESDSSGQQPCDDTHEPSAVLLWQEFHEAVDNLPPDYRELFDLLWYHELTQAEAAAVMKCSLATVKRRWVQARIKLQDAFPNMLSSH